uniref:Uncharacterized protein n=1 Tax=Tanacetum cinerariifolium TaxID=118510 RepID=A0A699JFC2_TANCI|nr:hypothetical protein [Tanacetum cinerariifolium]
MAFRNFIYTEDVEDLLFLPKEPSSGFSAGSPFVLVNTEPLKADEELVIRLAEVMADSKESLKPELFVVHHGSVAAQIKDMKCKTSECHLGLLSSENLLLGLQPSVLPIPRLLLLRMMFTNMLFLCLTDVFELKDVTACRLKISAITPPAWKNHLDMHMDVELLDLHDHCYARQAVADNERAREEECEELRAKYEAAMTEFE